MTLANLPRLNETTAGPDSPQSQIPAQAQAQIRAFAQRFGDAHLRLAYHAAFPLSLTPDLLYRLWGSVQDEGFGESETIPWVAVSDVLLVSGFCDCVGHDLYELDPNIRAELLRQIEADPRYGPGRIRELAEFVLAEAEALSHSPDEMQRDYAQVQRWGALAYVQPGQAAKELASALSHAYRDDEANLNRMATVVIHLADPLKDYPALIAYARGMARYARGDETGAIEHLKDLATLGKDLKVEGVALPLPDVQVGPPPTDAPPTPPPTRRLTQVALAVVSLVILAGGGYWLAQSLIWVSDSPEDVAIDSPVQDEKPDEADDPPDPDRQAPEPLQNIEESQPEPPNPEESEPPTPANDITIETPLPEQETLRPYEPFPIEPPAPAPPLDLSEIPELEQPDTAEPLQQEETTAPPDPSPEPTPNPDTSANEIGTGTPSDDGERLVRPIEPSGDQEGDEEAEISISTPGDQAAGTPNAPGDPPPEPPNDSEPQDPTETTLDLSQLATAFSAGNWREADDETWNLLLEAADEDESGWLSGEEIEGMSCSDLRAIDQQWLDASDGRFGFSVQARIWQEVGSPTEYNEQWEEFGDRVGWIEDGYWSIRLIDTSAPAGHYPSGVHGFPTFHVDTEESEFYLGLGPGLGALLPTGRSGGLILAATCNVL